MELIPANWRGEWGLWWGAWEALPDNPLYHYVRLSNQRRVERQPSWKRFSGNALIWLSAGLLTMILLSTFAGPPDMPEVLAAGFMFFTALLYLIWLASGILASTRDSLSVLSLPGRRSVWLQLDEMLSITKLSSHDIVLASVINAIAPLVPRIALGSLLIIVDMMLIYFIDNSSSFPTGSYLVLLMSPLTFASIGICGLLAALLSSLMLIIAGRGLTAERAQGFATINLLLFSIVWGIYAVILIGEMSSTINNFSPLTNFALNLMGAGAGILCVHLVCWLSSLRVWFRWVLALLGPGLLPLSLALGATLFAAISFASEQIGEDWIWDQGLGDMIGQLAMGYFRSWGAFAMFNPLAPPHGACWGVTVEPGSGFSYDVPFPYWCNLLLTIGVQLGLLIVLARHSRRAVELRRCNQP